MKLYTKSRQSGFTIVELLIVIVVIGILAAITIVAYNGIQQRGRDAQRRSDVASLQKALELFRAEKGGYPICGSATPYTPGGVISAGTVVSCLTAGLVPNYLTKLPLDPANSGSYQYFYGVGYRKSGAASYVGDATDNYMIGGKLETVTSPTYGGWGSSDLTMLVGSAN